jgi:hypothetical protein
MVSEIFSGLAVRGKDIYIEGMYLLGKRVTMSQERGAPGDHLEDVEDGCGCTEVWEHLSEHRDGE